MFIKTLCTLCSHFRPTVWSSPSSIRSHAFRLKIFLFLLFSGGIEDLTASQLSDLHFGQTSQSVTECLIGKTFFTRFVLRGKEEFVHPVVCGLTQQTVKQYSK